jgi:hypothetical protein
MTALARDAPGTEQYSTGPDEIELDEVLWEAWSHGSGPAAGPIAGLGVGSRHG